MRPPRLGAPQPILEGEALAERLHQAFEPLGLPRPERVAAEDAEPAQEVGAVAEEDADLLPMGEPQTGEEFAHGGRGEVALSHRLRGGVEDGVALLPKRNRQAVGQEGLPGLGEDRPDLAEQAVHGTGAHAVGEVHVQAAFVAFEPVGERLFGLQEGTGDGEDRVEDRLRPREGDRPDDLVEFPEGGPSRLSVPGCEGIHGLNVPRGRSRSQRAKADGRRSEGEGVSPTDRRLVAGQPPRPRGAIPWLHESPIRGHREKPQVHGVGLEPGGSRGDEEGASTAAAAPNPARPTETRASASAPSAPSRRRADPCPRRGSGRPAR